MDIPNLIVNENGEFVQFDVNGKTFDKSLDDDTYSISSVANLIGISQSDLEHDLNDPSFNACLYHAASIYRSSKTVYLINFGKKVVKIGRTLDITRRYTVDVVRNMLVRVTDVSNALKCENELIKKFKEKFEVDHGREYFKVPSLETAKNMFDRIVSPYRVNKRKKYDKRYVIGNDEHIYRLHSSIIPAIMSMYSKTDYDQCVKAFKIIEQQSLKINTNDISSTFVAFADNEEQPSQFRYWRYHGQTIIVDITHNLINISRINLRRSSQSMIRTFKSNSVLNGEYVPISNVQLNVNILKRLQV